MGSWARNQPRMDSDLDVVVLADDPAAYLETEAWVVGAVGGRRSVSGVASRLQPAGGHRTEHGAAEAAQGQESEVNATGRR